jgi:hypothetical protein
METYIAAVMGMAACFLAAAVLCRRYLELGIFRRVSVRSQNASIPAIRAITPAVEQELGRARRHERPLSVAIVEIRSDELLRQIRMLITNGYMKFLSNHWHGAQIVRVVFSLIGCLLRDTLRETDLVAYDPISDRYIIVMPETDKAAARDAIERIREVLLKRTATEAHANIAEFPIDGLTLDDLMQAAEIDERPSSDSLASEAAA